MYGSYDYATFTNADLTDARLSCYCIGTDFTGATLTYARLSNSEFIDSNFEGVDFSYANIDGFAIRNSNMSHTNFTGAEFEFGSLWDDFRYVNFTDATFNDVSFAFTDLTGANFTGATFNGVTGWYDTTCPDGSFSVDNGNTCEGHLTPAASGVQATLSNRAVIARRRRGQAPPLAPRVAEGARKGRIRGTRTAWQ